ncbi:MAG TPA: hypothetical protein VGV86_15340 [Acidimicrobiales bacterium]|nr:hypothetical protein [Acidimicrobiales bacterium]
MDAPTGDGRIPTVNRSTEKIRGDVARAGGADGGVGAGGGTIFTEPVLVVNQKAKVIELNNEYAIRILVVASALGVDTALKQDSRGFG